MSDATRPRHPLDAIFRPRSIAVVGASRKRDSIGFTLLHNLVMNEYNGAIFPVNPHAEVIHSLKCYPSLGAIPDPVDLAIVMVPKRLVEGVVDECIGIGAGGLVIISAGFGETGVEGRAVEQRLRDKVRAAGIRMVGPNCMGVSNTDPDVRMEATFAPVPAQRGHIGFVSQSGALGVAILNAAEQLGIGMTQFVSMGNKADVSGNDLLEYWENDPETRVICMYLESFGNPHRFPEIAKRVGRKKPILMVKSGRTAEGARAASSHTGAIAGADVTVSAFLEQCGVIRANTIDALFSIAQAFDVCPLPAGGRVAIVTNAGGPGIMATDSCVNLGLAMAEIAPETKHRLASFLPAEASLENPIDMIASATAESYRQALAAVLDDPGIDMVLAINVTPLLANPIDILEEIAEVTRDAGKPVLTVMMATEGFWDEIKGRSDLPPVYRFPEQAARALAQLHRYAAWRRKPEDLERPQFAVDDAAVERLLSTVEEGYLPQETAFRVLESYGIPVARRRQVRSAEEALAAAETIGYPVALKAWGAELVHKTETGAVKIDLRRREELESALEEMAASLRAAGVSAEGYLVQEMARRGHEVIFGLSLDPKFGPLLMFGLGGKYVEVFRDVRFGVTPLSPSEVREMIQGIRGFPLLEGVRGEPGADLAFLEEMLLRLEQLVSRHPRLRELDINPFLAAARREDCKAVDARIRVGAPVDPA